MFFEHAWAVALVRTLQHAVKPGGIAVVDVMGAGTTYMDMFHPGRYCLVGAKALGRPFEDWNILRSTHEGFDAPAGT